MHSISIFILSCCLLAVSDCLDDNDHEIINGDSALGTTTQQPQQQQKRRATTIPPPNFLDLPEDIIIEYEDASSYINNQNHNIEHMMGVSDERCDNARVIKLLWLAILLLNYTFFKEKFSNRFRS